MKHTLNHNGKTITYDLKISTRARRMRISVHQGGRVAVTIPKRISESKAHKFVLEKIDWVLEKSLLAPSIKNKDLSSVTRLHYLNNKKEALCLAKKKVVKWNKYFGFEFSEIKVKFHKTKWGSCSAKGNLNFNYKIIFLPEELQDYIVVHELCHLQEMNHSSKFWDLVGSIMPDYKKRKRMFREL